MNNCETCKLVEFRDSGNAPLWNCIIRTNYFDVAHAFNTSLPGWIVLVARRHVSAIDELSEEEAIELGILIRKISIELKAILNCAKTYVMQFAEQPGHSHVHFHVVPRMVDLEKENRGANIFNYLGASLEERVPDNEMNEIAMKLRNGMDNT